MFRPHSTLIALCVTVASVSADDTSLATLQHDFDEQVSPLIATHCLECHDAETQEAKLDLTVFRRLFTFAIGSQWSE